MNIQVSPLSSKLFNPIPRVHILSTVGITEESVYVAKAGSSDEASSLLSDDSVPGDIDADLESSKLSSRGSHSSRPDITGLQLLRTTDFYLLFLMLGLLTGIGLMTINNIGNDVSITINRLS
jgi:hypothetical protein